MERRATIREFIETSEEDHQRRLLTHRIYMALFVLDGKCAHTLPQKKNYPPKTQFPDMIIPFDDSDRKRDYQIKIKNVRPEKVPWEKQPPVFKIAFRETERGRFERLFLIKPGAMGKGEEKVYGPDRKEIFKVNDLKKVRVLVDRIVKAALRVYPQKS